MEIKHLIGICLAFFLIACTSGDMITGNTVLEVDDEKIKQLEAMVASLEQQLADRPSIDLTDASCGAQEKLIENLEEDLANQIKVNKQQRQVLVDLDRECVSAKDTCDDWEDEKDDLEEKNKKLQDMLDICQEDLS